MRFTDLLESFLAWIKSLLGYEPLEKPVQLTVLKPPKDLIELYYQKRIPPFHQVALCVRETPRACSTYRCIPTYFHTPRIEVWIYCDHLYPIAGEKFDKVYEDSTHWISIVLTPEQFTNRGANVLFAGEFNLRSPTTGRTIATELCGKIVDWFFRNRHDEIISRSDWHRKIMLFRDAIYRDLAQSTSTKQRAIRQSRPPRL